MNLPLYSQETEKDTPMGIEDDNPLEEEGIEEEETEEDEEDEDVVEDPSDDDLDD